MNGLQEIFRKYPTNYSDTDQEVKETRRNKMILPKSPTSTIKQDIADCVFDDIWSEVL